MAGQQEQGLSQLLDIHQGRNWGEYSASAAERARRLNWTRIAAKRLSQKYTSFPLPEDFNLWILNSEGIWLKNDLEERALVMGLILHSNGKGLMRRKNYEDALSLLVLAEEVFAGCNLGIFQRMDNLAILQIDIVWCYLMLRDILSLSMSGIRLFGARNQFQNLHGEDLNSTRKLELRVYMRLDLLEGVVAYCNGNLEQAGIFLSSAYARYLELRVSDEGVEQVMRLGFTEGEARKALRICCGNFSAAISFLVQERGRQIMSNPEFLCFSILELKIQRAPWRNNNGEASIQDNLEHRERRNICGPENMSQEEEIIVSDLENLLRNQLFEVKLLDPDITVEEEGRMIASYFTKLS